MAIDALRDGFVSLCFDPSNNILGDKCRMVLEGQVTAAGTVTRDVLTKVTSTRDVNALYGEGSVLAEALKTAISCCGNSAVEVFALPRADLAVGVAAQYELTFTGTATADGRVDIFWGDSQWNISVRIASGSTPTQIAAAVLAALPAGFPYTGTVAAGVITLTARNAGTVGNYLVPEYNWHGRNNYAPAGVTFAQARTVVGSGDPVALNYDTVLGECCVCCFALLSSDTTWQTALQGYLDGAWDCTKPQCFGHGYTYSAGTLGTILATDSNAATLSRLAHGVNAPILPWLKVAAYAAKSCCTTVDNPELSIQGPNLGVLDCVKAPERCADDFTFDERNQLEAGGFVVTVPVSGGEGSLTSPMIVNDITNNRFDSEGRTNLTFQSVSSRRLATETATQIAAQLQAFNGLGYFTNNTNIREGAQGTNRKVILGNMRAWAKSQIGVLFSEFDNLNEDLTITDDFETAPKCQGIPGKLQMNMIYRPPVRIRQVVVNAAPKLLNNC